MKLKPESQEQLKRIIGNDYGADLSDEEADRLGFSLLKISRMAMTAMDRAEEKHLTEKSESRINTKMVGYI